MRKIKNNLFALCLLFVFSGTANAQHLRSDVFDMPLPEVLDQIRERFNVELIYEERHVINRVVLRAPWRFFMELEATLDNVLRPLDMTWREVREGVIEIRNWHYFRKPYEEGARHVQALLEAYPDLDSWLERRAALRENMIEVMGLNGLIRSPLNPIKGAVRRFDGYTAQNIALETLPGVWVSGTLYKPARFRGRIPVFLSPHGHFGTRSDPNSEGRYRPDQQHRDAMLARMGIAVFSFDNFGGWGESALAFSRQVHRSDLGMIMQTWQGIRILDFFEEQRWADMTRVGITGGSGGGSQALFLAAIDDRITLTAPAIMMASHFFGGCPCESGLPIHFPPGRLPSNPAEIAAMAAPMPQLLISVSGDWTKTTPDIEYPYIKHIYGFFGKADNVENAHFPGHGHQFSRPLREALYDFVARHFGLNPAVIQNSAGEWDESRVTIVPYTDLLVFPDRQLPAHAIRGEQAIRELLATHRE